VGQRTAYDIKFHGIGRVISKRILFAHIKLDATYSKWWHCMFICKICSTSFWHDVILPAANHKIDIEKIREIENKPNYVFAILIMNFIKSLAIKCVRFALYFFTKVE